MKRLLYAFVLTTLSGFVHSSVARSEPVAIAHELVGYTVGADAVSLDYTLHVTNPSSETVTGLTLEFVPLSLTPGDRVIVSVDSLPPEGSADVSFRLDTPVFIEQADAAGQVLFWAGSCSGIDGAILEFPSESRPVGGGVQ